MHSQDPGKHRAALRSLPVHTLLGFALAISALGASHPARAGTGECPIEGFDSERIEQAARHAASCQQSFELFRLCSSTAGSDVAVGAAVTQRCESEFVKNLSKSEQQTYRRAQDRCARKYRHEAGIMYRSFEAFCGAKVASSYAKRAARKRP